MSKADEIELFIANAVLEGLRVYAYGHRMCKSLIAIVDASRGGDRTDIVRTFNGAQIRKPPCIKCGKVIDSNGIGIGESFMGPAEAIIARAHEEFDADAR